PDLETLSMDDLYNNLKIYEAEVMGSSSASQNTQNIAFMSSNITGNTNEAVKSIHGVSTAKIGDGLEMADGNAENESNEISQEDKKESRAPKYQDNKNKETMRRIVPVEETTSNDLVSQCDGFGYDWSDQAEEGPTNFALMAYISSGVYKACLESVDARLDVFEEEIKILKLDMSPGTMVYQ
ncbi:hypothetical protein Tco_0057166, partial [Tanacetum coccineum]